MHVGIMNQFAEDIAKARAEGRAEGAAEERARVVVWLEKQKPASGVQPISAYRCASLILCGEHLVDQT